MKKANEIIKELRIKKGFSLDYVAKELGYKSNASIYNIEIGKYKITYEIANKFATFFNVTPAYILGLETQEDTQEGFYNLLKTYGYSISNTDDIYILTNSKGISINLTSDELDKVKTNINDYIDFLFFQYSNK